MPPVKVPARDIIIQVNDPANAANWVQITQLTSATHNKGENEEVADTTTYDSDGEYEELVMQRGAVLELEGFLRKDPAASGERDAGQKIVDLWASKTGISSLGVIRFRHPMDVEWQVWDCTAKQGEEGGETNDMTSWEATFTRSGKKRTTAVA